jgi:hypothetical protein
VEEEEDLKAAMTPSHYADNNVDVIAVFMGIRKIF